ncbi:hypothetical protein ILYODFUR_006077 [Ilyodon furcidens]|uniref:Uncharacterized protein n=1 Tax=Ilyodon furcidens TaxID=33524 RepID=A0ABV0TGQ2_9TELE
MSPCHFTLPVICLWQLKVDLICLYLVKEYSIIFYTVYSIVGHGEAGVCLQQCTGERQGPPWTGHQSIAGQHRDIQNKQPCSHSFTPMGNLERPIHQTVIFLDCGRKPEYPERTNARTGRTCKLHAERKLNQGPSCCKATVLRTRHRAATIKEY